MRRILGVSLAGVSLLGCFVVWGKHAVNEALVRNYLVARNATMEAAATSADVEKALAFCSEDFVYEHPQVGARIEGKSAARRGIASHLGGTRNPRYKLKGTRSTPGVVVAEIESQFEASDQGKWVVVRRTSIQVFEIKDNLIRRILEYR